jgi:hypothetical protein
MAAAERDEQDDDGCGHPDELRGPGLGCDHEPDRLTSELDVEPRATRRLPGVDHAPAQVTTWCADGGCLRANAAGPSGR